MNLRFKLNFHVSKQDWYGYYDVSIIQDVLG